jgi:exonuclease SbcC
MATAREKETQRKLEHSQNCAKAIREAEEIRRSREANLKELEAKFTAIKEEQATTRAQINNAQKQTESLKGFPDEAPCKTCPLASSGLEARNSLPDLERKLTRLQERETKGTEVIANYIAQTKHLVLRASDCPDLSKWQPEAVKEIEEIIEKAKALSERANKAKPSEELLKEIDDVRGKVAKIPEVEGKLKKAREASLERAKIEEKIKANQTQEQKVEEELKTIVLPDVVSRIEVEGKLTTAKKELDGSRQAEALLQQRYGRQEAILDEHKRNREEFVKTLKEIVEREAKFAAYKALSKAFGRDGIPQLIVDSTIPHFQDIMTDLLSAFDGRWSIRIQSQKEKERIKGEYTEVVDILVHDGFSERDVRTYSGGEKQVLKTIIRIAFATLQAERSGKGLKILVLDEATDKMETSLSEPFMKMLGKISRAFNQVFIVSHVDHVLIALPSRISLYLEGGSTKAIVTT